MNNIYMRFYLGEQSRDERSYFPTQRWSGLLVGRVQVYVKGSEIVL